MTDLGTQMKDFISELYPICRSITGDGLRKTLDLVRQRIPIQIHELPTGTKVLDWTIPKEWNIRDAYIVAPTGERFAEFQKHNLHIVNYSRPINTTMSLEELKPHLHSIPEHPDWIPYRTSYYKEDWGFCVQHNKLTKLQTGNYQVVIDSSLEDGSMSYGELLIKGESEDEIIISCHSCHPSLCNDNLSGIALATFLAQSIRARSNRYSYRFLFAPGTIGAIAWLARNRDQVQRIKHGLVVACVGDSGIMQYKKSRRGNTELDRAVEHCLRFSKQEYKIRKFVPYGYDERQFCSPGFDLAVGSLTRTPHGQYEEYHTSADNLEFVIAESLNNSLQMYHSVIELLESNLTYKNLQPYGEPQLGRRGLYRTLGGTTNTKSLELAMLWVLNLSDGNHSLLDIAERAQIDYTSIQNAASLLQENGLIEKCF